MIFMLDIKYWFTYGDCEVCQNVEKLRKYYVKDFSSLIYP